MLELLSPTLNQFICDLVGYLDIQLINPSCHMMSPEDWVNIFVLSYIIFIIEKLSNAPEMIIYPQ